MKTKKDSSKLFNFIAPVYGWFYKSQKKRYKRIIEEVAHEIDLKHYETIIDLGCGTGALASTLDDMGLKVTAVDQASKMIKIAKKKNKDKSIQFIQGDLLEALPFKPHQFDLAIASYVAHGLSKEERRKMYFAMSRLAKDYVIIHDYNANRAPLTSFVEYLEGGDYFYFIDNAEKEMEACIQDMKTCFSEVKVIDVDIRASWYLCKVDPNLKEK
jgi:ubiquinone/menaquinone biosynthesis C-methylase UbiE